MLPAMVDPSLLHYLLFGLSCGIALVALLPSPGWFNSLLGQEANSKRMRKGWARTRRGLNFYRLSELKQSRDTSGNGQSKYEGESRAMGLGTG